MKIEVEVRFVYGAPNIYPVNEAAKLACALTGKRTFKQQDLKLLQSLGHEVVEVNPNKLQLSG